jgi:hypothetical protein
MATEKHAARNSPAVVAGKAVCDIAAAEHVDLTELGQAIDRLRDALRWHGKPVWGIAEVLKRTGMSRQLLAYHRRRGNFPKPLCTVNAGRTELLDPLEVKKWDKARQARREAP